MANNDPNQFDIYSVTRLNREVKAVLEGSFPVMWVKGEISNFAQPASGHMYFSLKDANSQVRCAMFRGRNRMLKFNPQNGDEVLLLVNVSLYEDRGEFQLIVEQMEPAGAGALQRAYEELKQKLNKEGLFSQDEKKPLPDYPNSIGVITSATGAAIRDILHVIKRRYPIANVNIYPVPVQGDGAAIEITKMLDTVIQRNEVDVLLFARGGGSIEDLWAFNDETLVRKIFDCPIPTVSGVGHEIDFTITDFVVDVRAPTPSAAAEIICPDVMNIKQSLQTFENQLKKIVSDTLNQFSLKLDYLSSKLMSSDNQIQSFKNRLKLALNQLSNRTLIHISKQQNDLQRLHNAISIQNPANQLKLQKEKLKSNTQQLINLYEERFKTMQTHVNHLKRSLDIMNPLSVLNRGYSVVTLKDGRLVQSIKQLNSGDDIDIKLSNGIASAEVTKLKGNE